MKLIINKDRSVIPIGTWGTVNENDYEILDFEFPEELDGYNKRIVYYLGDEKVWDAIVDNKAYITNAITTKGDVKAYVWCTKENTEREADTDFRTMLFDMHFYENENADGIVPTPEQIDGFNTMLTAMNAKIDEVDALETTIETAETERQEAEATRVSNESTRESNESTRQTNEQTRQTQEADRERRTDEAIADIEDKTAEYNANAEAKTTAFNNNATQKTNDFNSNYTQKVNAFNSNATSKTTAFNSNATDKTTNFDNNASSKTTTFNENATTKTNAFNSNATEKTTTFDNNASTKTSEFNSNAESKTSAFNDNATQKTTNFDNNASEKTFEFNNNAQEKIDEYDEHIVEYQAQIDELQEEVEELSENMPWNTTEQATEISVDDAAKYSKNKLELFGNAEQTQYTGVQLLDMSDTVNGYFTSDEGGTNNAINGFHVQKYIDVGNNTSVYGRFEALANIKIGRFWIQEYDENYNSLRRTLLSLYDRAIENKEVRKGSITLLDNTKFIRIAAYSLKELVNEEYVERNPMKDSWNDLVKATISFTDVDIYEPYVGGVPSPNPNYPQDIHVVSGENTIEVQGKNLIDYSALNKYNRDLSGAPSVGSPLRYYNNSKALQFNVSVSNFVGKNIFFSFDFSHTNFRRFALDTNGNYIETFSNGGLIKENYSYITILINSNVDIPTSTDIKFMAVQGSTATSYVPYYHADYPINLGDIELCKIGDYQDYLYKENGNWYKYGAINKKGLSVNSNWYKNAISGNVKTQRFSVVLDEVHIPNIGYSDLFKIKSVNDTVFSDTEMIQIGSGNDSKQIGVIINIDRLTEDATSAFKTWLSNNPITLYRALGNPTITQITDETLIDQLEAIYNHLALVKGTNHITITPSDLAPYVTLNYMQDLPSKLDNLDSRLSLLE